MRGLGLFFGVVKRNVPLELVNPHPVKDLGDDVHSGNAGLDGFSALSRADPNRQGDAPFVKGIIGRTYMGPDESFEQ